MVFIKLGQRIPSDQREGHESYPLCFINGLITISEGQILWR